MSKNWKYFKIDLDRSDKRLAFFILRHLYLLLSQNFLAYSGGRKTKKFLSRQKEIEITIQTSLQNIVKIPAQGLGKFHLILTKISYSLDEIVDYDDGRSYENWSTDNGIQIILDICPPHQDQSEQIVSEIIDCWLELCAIRNALEAEVETNISLTEHKYSEFDELIENIHNLEKEMQDDDAIYRLMIKDEVDTVLVSYYTLDEETRQAVLQ